MKLRYFENFEICGDLWSYRLYEHIRNFKWGSQTWVLSVEFFREGLNRGFDPSFGKIVLWRARERCVLHRSLIWKLVGVSHSWALLVRWESINSTIAINLIPLHMPWALGWTFKFQRATFRSVLYKFYLVWCDWYNWCHCSLVFTFK
jgi:hypothetical protein